MGEAIFSNGFDGGRGIIGVGFQGDIGGFDHIQNFVYRITSYNVCYTKLLRTIPFKDQPAEVLTAG